MQRKTRTIFTVLFLSLAFALTLTPMAMAALLDVYDVTISDLPTEVMNRGEDVTFTVTVLLKGDSITGAGITFNDPKGGTLNNQTTSIIANGDGTYSVTYTIADDDPVGSWNIIANATKCTTYTGESLGDTVEISATYTIYDIVSPIVGTTKNRGQTVDFDFKVKDASDDPVSGLTSLALDGISVPITEDESIAGHYTGSYTILSTDATGTYDGTVSKNGNTGTQSGWLIISDVLVVDVSTDKNEYQRTETVVITADVDYQDGSPVLDASVNATLRWGIFSWQKTNVTLLDDGVGSDLTANDGIYTGTYKTKTDDCVKTWSITADASKDGNTGSDSTDIEVVGAELKVVCASLSPNIIERTMEVTLVFNIYYPDNVTELTSCIDTIKVYNALDVDVTSDFVVGVPIYSDGVWTVVIDSKIDTPTGAGYSIGVSATSCDEHDVTPEQKTEFCLETDGLFEVNVALLNVVVTSTESDYLTEKNVFGGLETVYFTAHINYPDGTDFTEAYGGVATADIWIDTNANDAIDVGEFVVVTSLSLSYNTLDEWLGTFDLHPPGAIQGIYKIKVSASDAESNSGDGIDLFNVIAQTIKDPTHGPVGTSVTEIGSGFAPFAIVSVVYTSDNHSDYVGLGNGVTTEFDLILMDGINMIGFLSETIFLNEMETSAYSIDYAIGVVTFDTAPAYGVVITANYQLEILVAQTMTNEYGSFVVTFTVPESYAGEHEVHCIDSGFPIPNFAVDIFTVEPQIELSSTKGPPGAWITVTGTGFAPNTPVVLDAVLAGLFQEESWAIAYTDSYGTFAKGIVLPILNLQMMYMKGAPVSIAPIGIIAYDTAENHDLAFYVAFLLCEGASIDVEVEVGDHYFPGEVMTAYASVSIDGVPADVENLEFLLYHENLEPIPMSMYAPIIRIEPGLYSVTTTLPPDMESGNYLFKVEAGASTHTTWSFAHIELWELWWAEWADWFEDTGLPEEWTAEWNAYGVEWWLDGGIEATINGVGIDGFIMSPTLAGMGAVIAEIYGTMATVVIPGIGQIQLDLFAVQAQLMGIEGNLAIIQTRLGTMEVALMELNFQIMEVNGNLVTISTNLGELEGRIISIEGEVATIYTDVGTVKLAIPQLEKTSLYMPIELILSAFAAIAAIAACVIISKKIL